MHSGWYWGEGSSWWWAAMMCVTTTVLIAVVVWAAIRSSRSGGTAGMETPQSELDRRYARGEIDTSEYEERSARLHGGPRSRCPPIVPVSDPFRSRARFGFGPFAFRRPMRPPL